ncbi:MAG TPA: hypothetical protein VMW38_25795 [Terriglobia bacterium]|nr:hypothetical protein [Terriglobia bacterium]
MSNENQSRTPGGTLEEAMASAWEQLSNHYNEVRAKQGLLWNRVNSIDILNTFLALHGKLASKFNSEYAQLEKIRVQDAMVRYQNGQPQLAEEIPTDLAELPESQNHAICWEQVLASYCDIHGRLKVELRAWNQDDYRQFESIISNLLQRTLIRKISTSN